MFRISPVSYLVAILALAVPSYAADICPNPLPTCSGPSGSLSDLTGTFGCTSLRNNTVGVSLIQIRKMVSPGDGTMTMAFAQNYNYSDATTYQDFGVQTLSLSYCINSDDTGYITGPGLCAIAFILDKGKTELRLMGSSENLAAASVCRKQ